MNPNRFFKRGLLFLIGTWTGMVGVNAQSYGLFYPENQSGYSITTLPNSDLYVAGGTIYAANGDNRIHLVRYDINDFVINSIYLDQVNYDDRLVKIIPVTSEQVFVIAYSEDLSQGISDIHFMRVDFAQTAPNHVVADQVFRSDNPFYTCLTPTDAVYQTDPTVAGEYLAVCGTASPTPRPGETVNKQAFVLRYDGSSTVLRFYNSGSSAPEDFDVASRIMNDAAGNLYVTGSENMFKPAIGGFTMGIKSMYLNPSSLALIWSTPIQITPYWQENGVDMVELNGDFNILANRRDDFTWGIIRVNPITGVPNGFVETNDGPRYIAHHFMPGNNRDELVVAGMRYNLKEGSCGIEDPYDAAPFLTFVDRSSYPATAVQTINYHSMGGTHDPSLTVNYWQMGDFYSPLGQYNIPMYLPKFAVRNIAPGPGPGPIANGGYSIIAPLMNRDMATAVLNTKLIYTYRDGTVNCPFTACYVPLLPLSANAPAAFPSPAVQPSRDFQGVTYSADYPFTDYAECPRYYRPAGNTSGIKDAPPAKEETVFPNPATSGDELNIVGSGFSRYSIVSSVGQVVQQGVLPENNRHVIALEHMAPGLYFVNLQTETAIVTHKIVIR